MQIGDPIPGYYVGMPFNGYPGHRIPLTPEEESEREQWAAEQAKREADEAKAAEDKEKALASAHAKLKKLGLNADEIAQ